MDLERVILNAEVAEGEGNRRDACGHGDWEGDGTYCFVFESWNIERNRRCPESLVLR